MYIESQLRNSSPRELLPLPPHGSFEYLDPKENYARIVNLRANGTFAFPCLLPPFVDVRRRQRGWPKSHESPHGRYGRVQIQTDYVARIDLPLYYDSRTSIRCNLYSKNHVFYIGRLRLSPAVSHSISWFFPKV